MEMVGQLCMEINKGVIETGSSPVTCKRHHPARANALLWLCYEGIFRAMGQAPGQTGWKVVRLDFWAKLPPAHIKVCGSSFAQIWTAEPVIISSVTDTQLL